MDHEQDRRSDKFLNRAARSGLRVHEEGFTWGSYTKVSQKARDYPYLIARIPALVRNPGSLREFSFQNRENF